MTYKLATLIGLGCIVFMSLFASYAAGVEPQAQPAKAILKQYVDVQDV